MYSSLISNLVSDPTVYCFSSSTNMNNLTYLVKQTDDKKLFNADICKEHKLIPKLIFSR